jgi:hypothetical protein
MIIKIERGWSEVSRKHLEKYFRDSVRCNESDEREYIKKIIEEEFPMLNETVIELAIKRSCGITNMPMPTDLFITLMKRRLEKFIE